MSPITVLLGIGVLTSGTEGPIFQPNADPTGPNGDYSWTVAALQPY
jgi:hypothetical protein